MGRRGPAPKPTALKALAGNPGKRPLPKGEPVPPAGEPEAPEFADPRARAVWDQLVPRLARIGLARSIDGIALERYCAMLVQWRDAAAFCARNGTVYSVKGEKGKVMAVRELPQAAAVRKLHQSLLLIEREFGLSPASRTRINVETERSAKGDVDVIKQKLFDQPLRIAGRA